MKQENEKKKWNGMQMKKQLSWNMVNGESDGTENVNVV
jgi:hypothetical protein